MSDGTLSAGVVDAPINSGQTATPEVEPGAGATAPETEQQAGGAEGSSDGGSVTDTGARQRGKSVYSQVRELNAKLREQRGYYESELGGLKQQLEEIRSQVGQGRQTQKQGKTFWEAPEEVLEERLSSHLGELEKRMQTKFAETQAQREASQVRQQEVSEAAKFIRTQKGITEEDVQDIREILQSNPDLEHLSPMDQAEFALYKWQKERGIGDNTAKKNRASTVTGAPASGGGPKIWTESEIKAEIAKFPQDISQWSKDDEAKFKRLDDEFKRAYRENRVSK